MLALLKVNIELAQFIIVAIYFRHKNRHKKVK